MGDIGRTDKTETTPEASGVTSSRPDSSEIDTLRRELFRARQECRRARYRHWKLEQVARQLVSSATGVPTRVSGEEGPDPTLTGHVLAHLDECQLLRGPEQRFYLRVKGWAWSLSSSIIAVDLFLNEARWQQLDYGDPRHDVRQHFGGPAEMEHCGFSECLLLPETFTLDTVLTVQACDVEGHWKRFQVEATPAARSDEPSRIPWIQDVVGRTNSLARTFQAQRDLSRQSRQIRRLAARRFQRTDVTFGFILPVDGESEELLGCIDSLRRQFLGCWQLTLVPRGAAAANAARSLLKRGPRDTRITCASVVEELFADTCNRVWSESRANYVGILDASVTLTDDALCWASATVLADPQIAWLYADGVDVDRAGRWRQSDCKPDFSAFHLWSRYFTHGFSVYRREEVLRAQGLRAQRAGAELYDLELRLAEQVSSDRIVHVAETLFRRRSCGENPHAESREAAELAAVRETLKRVGITGTVAAHGVGCGVHRIELVPATTPPVTIVIPTRDKADLLRRCIDSLRAATNYPDYRILVINNQSTEPALHDFLAEQRNDPRFSCLNYDRPFNHSAMHNEVLFDLDAEYALLLNNDVSDFSPRWLEQLVAAMQLDSRIAGVGAMLLYPDRRVQHGGVTIGLGGGAAHSHLDVPHDRPGYRGRLHCLQDLSACTAACLLVRLSAFREIGGFDSVHYPVGFNDVDLWLRWRAAGYRCVYQPAVTAVHFESVSRGVAGGDGLAAERLQKCVADSGYRDPFYNPNLSLACERFRDLLPPDEAWSAQRTRLRSLLLSASIDDERRSVEHVAHRRQEFGT